jgi:protein-disulfide isomerase
MSQSHKLLPPLRSDDHTRGITTAAVVLMEYGDFQCARSGIAYGIIKSLQTRLGDRICFIFRHFPQITRHPQSMKAAETAEAAASQGKFWEMHDALFEYQADPKNISLEDASLVECAIQIDLDIPQFLQELSAHVHLPRIQTDIESGQKYDVQNTPTFFVGVRHQGYENLETLVLQILQLEIPE